MTDLWGWAKNHRVILPGNAILLNGVVQSARRGGEIGVPGFQPIRGGLRLIRIQRSERLFLGRLGRLFVEIKEAGIIFADVLHNFPVRP
jgi:predicted small integral membrane protein